MKRILITGHNGFIGSALTAVLRERNELEIVGISRSSNINLVNYKSIADLPKMDKIVHLAGFVGVMSSWDNAFEAYQNNVIPTLNILKYASIHKTPLVHMSSYVYGTPKYLPIDEKHPVACNNPYAKSKRLAEMLCEAYAVDFGLPVTILRPFNIYGPGQSENSLIPDIIKQVVDKHVIQIKDLRPKRDYLYVDDLVLALVKVIHSHQEGLQIYNLGFGKSHSVLEVIDTVVKLLDGKYRINCADEYRPNEIMDCFSNSRKFFEHFDWKPQTNLEEGIIKLLEFEKMRKKGNHNGEN